MNGRARQIVWTAARLLVAAALLTYLARSGVIEWSALEGLLTAWPFTLFALTVSALVVAATAWRFCVLLRPCGMHLPLAASIRLTLISICFSTCLPGGTAGDVVRVYYASAPGGRTAVATIALLDRAVGLFAMFLAPLVVAPFFPELIARSSVLAALLAMSGAAAAALLAMWVALCYGRDRGLLERAVSRLPFGEYAATVIATCRAYRGHPRTMVAAAAIGLCCHGLSFLVILSLSTAVSGSVRPEVMVLTAFGFLANNLPLTPGGLGVGEAVFDRLFLIAGLAGGAESMLGWRLLTIVQALCGLALYVRGRHSAIVRVPAPEIWSKELMA